MICFIRVHTPFVKITFLSIRNFIQYSNVFYVVFFQRIVRAHLSPVGPLVIQVGELAQSLHFDVLKQNFHFAKLNFSWKTLKFKMTPKMAATGVRSVKPTPMVDTYVDSHVFLVKYVLKNVLRPLQKPLNPKWRPNFPS